MTKGQKDKRKKERKKNKEEKKDKKDKSDKKTKGQNNFKKLSIITGLNFCLERLDQY